VSFGLTELFWLLTELTESCTVNSFTNLPDCITEIRPVTVWFFIRFDFRFQFGHEHPTTLSQHKTPKRNIYWMYVTSFPIVFPWCVKVHLEHRHVAKKQHLMP
jgi:hypothetical protein